MSTLSRKTGGVWGVSVAWSKMWKKTSGVWSVLYTRAFQIYKDGVEYVGITLVGSHASVEKLATYFKMRAQDWRRVTDLPEDEAVRAGTATLTTVNTIDFTQYIKAYVTGQVTIAPCGGSMSLATISGLSTSSVVIPYSNGYAFTLTLDITAIVGFDGLVFKVASGGNTAETEIYITEIRLE
jgi:hypothetical protein